MDGYNSGQGERSTEYVCAFQNDFSKPLQNKFGYVIRAGLLLSPDVSELEGEGEGRWGGGKIGCVLSSLDCNPPTPSNLLKLSCIN